MPGKAWGVDYDVMYFGAEAPRAIFSEEGDYAVVDICGPLSQRPGWWSESYDEIRERFAAACQSSKPAVCLKIDSPGGDTMGNLELARDLRAMAATAGKRLVAFTDGAAQSAAYALACAAGEIVTTPSASVGSIGVWCPLVDVTAQDAMFGVKYYVAASGTAKNDRNPHTGITDEAFARLKAQVDLLAGNFAALVAEFRPSITVEAIAALEGADLFGPQGLAAGLSDRIVNSWQAFLANEEGSQMSKYDEAMGALKRAAEGDDEDAKKAKKALKALEQPPEETEEDKKKKDDEAKAKAAEEEKKDTEAKALAANAMALAQRVQSLEADAAARVRSDAALADARARAELMAKRPDFSEAVRATLASVPIAKLEEAVKTWPRVTATPGSSAAATVPAGAGEPPPGAGARAMSPAEQAVFDRTDPFKRSKTSAKASFQGNEFTMPSRMITNEEAAARVAELEKEMGGVR